MLGEVFLVMVTLQRAQQSSVDVIVTVWSPQPKIFTIWLFIGKVS